MLLIEFEENLKYGLNILKYRNITDDNWYYLYIDIETLNLLVSNFGIISTLRMPTQYICADNPSTSKTINIKYCNAPIEFYCGDNTYNNTYKLFNFTILEQNY
jgi:hypothetical protein